MWARLLFGFAVIMTLGCGTPKFASVSGKVTLNGKPLPHAVVLFQPVGEPGALKAGEGSTGKTNDRGEFTLRSSTGIVGALIGKHQVSITAPDSNVGAHDTRPPRGGWPVTDKVPARYNAKSELTCDVPPGGTNKANFDLTTP